MLSIRTNIAYLSLPKVSTPAAPDAVLVPANTLLRNKEEDLSVCPHCGADLKQEPDSVFNFQSHEVLIRSPRNPNRIYRRAVPPKTWALLEYLLQNIGKYRTTERVHMACFDEEVDTGIVTVQIGFLRKLLDNTPYFIETKYGVGYRLLRR